jgi:hypothetical protein
MAQKIPIKVHVANALQWLGTLYRSPADALKEHVSNAIDEHLKAQLNDSARERCHVRFTLDRRQVVVEYPYGMSRPEFVSALQRVADSVKRTAETPAIGRLGIGIFSFQQLGRKCTFHSRKTAAGETLRVVLREGSDEAIMESSLARESLAEPGLRVVISELKFDPTRPRGPLAPELLRRHLAEKFDAYLREGWLSIEIVAGIGRFQVTPARLLLPRLLADVGGLTLPRDSSKRVRLELYFDPSGKGRVLIRHQGVAIVDDLSTTSAYGLEDSAYARGFVRGYIDANFLKPMPSRSGFEETDDWVALLDLLDRYRPTLEAELETHLAEHRDREAADLGQRALRIARDILDLDEFRDLALPGGLAKRQRPGRTAQAPKARGREATRTRRSTVNPGNHEAPEGRRIRYEEVPFENGSTAHSRFASGVVQTNTLHPDYAQAARTADGRLTYAALMIGKETIAFNDRTGAAGDFLEKLLDFYFKLQTRTRSRGKKTLRTISSDAGQAHLDLPS